MNKLFTCLLFVSLLTPLFAQSFRVESPKVHQKYLTTPDKWVSDAVIIPTEPIGGISGTQKADGTIYMAINDTLYTSNLGILIMKSTNGGITWQNAVGLTYRGKTEYLKLVRTGLDSIYCFFQVGFDVYSWNIESSFINTYFANGGYRSFDVEATSFGTLHVFVDSLTTKEIRRYLSTNGGYAWGGRGLITSDGASPKLSKSQSGDTLFLNYRGPVLADTANSIVRVARYRETTAGVLAYVTLSFYDVALEVLPKLEYKTAGNNGEVWIAYTVENAGISQVYIRKSTNYGVAFTTTEKVFEGYTANLYGIDLKSKIPAGSGFDLLVYYDSTQTGVATNNTDKLLLGTATQGGVTFNPFLQISNNPPVYSPNYSPILIELPYVYNSTGAAWVGDVTGQKKVLWDAMHIVPVELTALTANVVNGNTVINWSTATETNNKGFEIQKSLLPSSEFKTIGYVNGNGTSTTVHNYSFIDKNFSGEKTYYRLKQIDYNGQTDFSKTIEVESSIPVKFELSQNYPNPFNPSTLIRFSVPQSGNVKMELYNVLGKKVAVLLNENKEAGSYSVTLNADKLNLTSGVYFYSIESNNSKLTKKLMLIK